MEYNIAYFKKKFSAIPEEKWCVGVQINYHNQRCAFGWCMPPETTYNNHTFQDIPGHETDEGKALKKMFNEIGFNIAHINNGKYEKFPQSNPRARVLAALDYIEQLDSNG